MIEFFFELLQHLGELFPTVFDLLEDLRLLFLKMFFQLRDSVFNGRELIQRCDTFLLKNITKFVIQSDELAFKPLQKR